MDYKISKEFDVTIKGLTFKYEFFTLKHITTVLDEMKMNYILVDTENKNTRAKLREIYLPQGEEKFHFFSFIRFFKDKNDNDDDDEKKYGIVGGKTNYPNPDIWPDNLQENDNRYARNFLNCTGNIWYKKVLIVNHAENLAKDIDEQQALFTECFLQRKFNLFDS